LECFYHFVVFVNLTFLTYLLFRTLFLFYCILYYIISWTI
jgi:hypothetical protein